MRVSDGNPHGCDTSHRMDSQAILGFAQAQRLCPCSGSAGTNEGSHHLLLLTAVSSDFHHKTAVSWCVCSRKTRRSSSLQSSLPSVRTMSPYETRRKTAVSSSDHSDTNSRYRVALPSRRATAARSSLHRLYVLLGYRLREAIVIEMIFPRHLTCRTAAGVRAGRGTSARGNRRCGHGAVP